MKIESKNN